MDFATLLDLMNWDRLATTIKRKCASSQGEQRDNVVPRFIGPRLLLHLCFALNPAEAPWKQPIVFSF